MKKRWWLTVISVACAIACVFGIAACGGNDSNVPTDKAKQNAEFVEYRKKVVSVLDDNDIFINDYDNITKGKTAKAQAAAGLASGWNEDKTPIKNLLVKPEYLQTGEEFGSIRHMVYARSLRLSLFIGDGIATYFNEKNFYGITVKIGEEFFKVTKNNNDVYHIQGYTSQLYDGDTFELYDSITLRYTSVDDYEFTSVEWNNNDNNEIFFAYGNSDKELLVVNASNESGEAVYSPDTANFYITQDRNAVSQCIEHVEYAKPADAAPYRALKSEVRYTISDRQNAELTEKYFKDVQTDKMEVTGLQTEEIDGKKVAVRYIADGELTVNIPSDIEYISEQFLIDDLKGTVNSIYIPASVKGISDLDGRSVDLENPEIPEPFRIDRFVGTGNDDRPLYFVKIQSGSTLFKAGEGHLYSRGGRLLYVADKAMQGLDYDVLSYNDLDFSKYKNLLKNFAIGGSLTVQLDRIAENEKIDFNLQNLFKLLNPSELNIEGGGSLAVEELHVTQDVTVNIDNIGKDGYVNINMVNSSDSEYNVTVNVTGFEKSQFISVIPKQPEKAGDEMFEFVSNDKIFTTFNVDMDETYFLVFCKDRIERDRANSKINLEPSTESMPKGFYVNLIDEERNIVMLRLDSDIPDGTYEVPTALLGYTVEVLMLDLHALRGKSLKIKVDEATHISFIGNEYENDVTLDNVNFVLKYSGTYNELHDKLQSQYIYNENNYDIVFTAECSDRTDVMKLGWKYSDTNPDNFKFKTTIRFKGEQRQIHVGESFHHINLIKYFEIDANKLYYLSDGESVPFKLNYEDFGDGNVAMVINVPYMTDSEYTLFELEQGIRDHKLTDAENRYDLSITVRMSNDDAGENIVITSGTALGKPVFIMSDKEDLPPAISDEDRFFMLNGIRCSLFNEFELPLGTDENNIVYIRAKIVIDDRGGFKLEFCGQITTYEVTVTLCDGSQLRQSLLEGEKIAFDPVTWKIEKGYAYFYEYSKDKATYCNYLDTDSNYLDIFADNLNITLRKIIIDQEKTFDLKGADYAVSGKLNVYYDENDGHCYIRSTVESATVNGTPIETYTNVTSICNTNIHIARSTVADFSCDLPNGEYINITERYLLDLQWDVDSAGNISVRTVRAGNIVRAGYLKNGAVWEVEITDNIASVSYSVDGDIIGSGECEVSELAAVDKDKAVIAEREVADGNGGMRTERYYIYIDSEITESGEIVINGVSYKKEIVSAA